MTKLVDYDKPIQYTDGSPATYLGIRPGGLHGVTPYGQPYSSHGNWFDNYGSESGGSRLSRRIENVPALENKTDEELAETLRKHRDIYAEAFEELVKRGYSMISVATGRRVIVARDLKISKEVVSVATKVL